MSSRDPARGFLYAARVHIFERFGPRQYGPPQPGWKIGFTRNLLSRAGELASLSGFELVAVGRGTTDDETAAHHYLSALRLPGGTHGCLSDARDWFRDGPEMHRWLAKFPAIWRGRIAGGEGSAHKIRALWLEMTGGEVAEPETVTLSLLRSRAYFDGYDRTRARCSCRATVVARDGTTTRLRIVSNTRGVRTAKTGLEVTVDATTGREVTPRTASWWQVDDADLTALRAFDTRDDVRRTKGAA